MPEAAAILARLDAIMRDIAELRAELVASTPALAADERRGLCTRTYLKIADCCRSDINVE